MRQRFAPWWPLTCLRGPLALAVHDDAISFIASSPKPCQQHVEVWRLDTSLFLTALIQEDYASQMALSPKELCATYLEDTGSQGICNKGLPEEALCPFRKKAPTVKHFGNKYTNLR